MLTLYARAKAEDPGHTESKARRQAVSEQVGLSFRLIFVARFVFQLPALQPLHMRDAPKQQYR